MKGKWRETGWVLCLCVVVSVPFLPSLQGRFVDWDDPSHLTENPLVHAGIRDGLVPLVTRPQIRLYMPVSMAAFWAQYHIWGMMPFGYHLVNLLIHLSSAALVYLIFMRLLEVRWAAFAAALWWGVHPLNVEPVAWVTGLKDVLALALMLLSLYLYIVWRQRGINSPARSRTHLWCISLAAFSLACLAKPLAAAFPIVPMAYDVVMLRVRGRKLWMTAPYFIVSVLVIIITTRVQRPEELGLTALGIFERLRLVGDSSAFYLRKIFWPEGLSAIYDHSVASILLSRWSWMTVLLVGILYVLALVPGNAWRLALVVFIAGFAPVSGLVAFNYQAHSTVADRYVYFSTVGIALILGDVACRLGSGQSGRPSRRGTVALVCLLLWSVPLGVATWNQARVWHDSEALWKRVTEVAPRLGKGWRCMGDVLLGVGDLGTAIGYYSKAIELDPNDAIAYNGRCCAWAQKGNFDEAIRDGSRAIQIRPAYYEAYNNRSTAWAAKGDLGRAIEDCNHAIRINPTWADSYYNRALVRYQAGQYEEAWADITQCRRLGGGPNTAFIQALQEASGRTE